MQCTYITPESMSRLLLRHRAQNSGQLSIPVQRYLARALCSGDRGGRLFKNYRLFKIDSLKNLRAAFPKAENGEGKAVLFIPMVDQGSYRIRPPRPRKARARRAPWQRRPTEANRGEWASIEPAKFREPFEWRPWDISGCKYHTSCINRNRLLIPHSPHPS